MTVSDSNPALHGLSCEPFAASPEPRFLLPTAPIRSALGKLRTAVESGAPCIVVVGREGVGKSVLCGFFQSSFGEGARVARIDDPGRSWDVLQAEIEAQLQLAHGLCGASLKDEYRLGRRVVVLIDRAEDLTPENLAMLETRTAADPGGQRTNDVARGADAQLVFFARDELDACVFSWLASRDAMRVELPPLGEGETHRYLEWRLNLAGADDRTIFTPTAMSAIHAESEGVPRAIDTLATRLLDYAARGGRTTIDAGTVGQMLGGVDPTAPDPVAAVLATVETSEPAEVEELEVETPGLAEPARMPAPAVEIRPGGMRPWVVAVAAMVGSFVGGACLLLVSPYLLGALRPVPVAVPSAPAAVPPVAAGPPVVPGVPIVPAVPVDRVIPVAESVPVVDVVEPVVAPEVERPPAPEPVADSQRDPVVAIERAEGLPEPEPIPEPVERAVEPSPAIVEVATLGTPTPIAPMKAPEVGIERPVEPPPVAVAEPVESAAVASAPEAEPLAVEATIAADEPAEVESPAPRRFALPVHKAERLLARSFDALFGGDLVQSVTFVTLEGGAERPIDVLDLARMEIGGRVHTLAAFAGAGPLKESRILSIETGRGEDERYAYLPDEGRALRLGASSGFDPFDGTGFRYEDFRPRHVADYEIESLEQSRLGDEAVYVVTATPRFGTDHDRVEFFLGWEDAVLLESRQFHAGDSDPTRVVTYPREQLESQGSFVRPGLMVVHDHATDVVAEARLTSAAATGRIDAGLFTLSRLRSSRIAIPRP